jgi:3'(2'), 5'-bisphosphate nucleotidase
VSDAYTEEVAVARRLAREAGRLILEVYATDFDVVEKAGGQGPVTEADQRANGQIVAGLRAAFPNDDVIAEESVNDPAAPIARRRWFVDPLDGTREFVARNGEFAIHIGLAVEGSPVVGVVYRPVGDRLYAGVVGHGCEVEVEGARRPVRVAPPPSDLRELRLVVSRSHLSRKSRNLAEALGITQIRPTGSVGVKCGLIAEGDADLYLHASRGSSRWDSCAPEAVLRAAGGRVTRLSGLPYRYDTAELGNDEGLFACAEETWPLVRDALARALER